jgi:putative ABC transport system substrate-binding protein
LAIGVRRRNFIKAIGGAAAWPLAAGARPAERMRRIGLLLFGDDKEFGGLVRAFKVGMAERGYQDAKNVQFDARYSDASAEKLARNAHALAAANVEVIWVPGSTAAKAAREATAAIPIVFAIVSDPVQSGFAKSLAAPGANMTGLSLLSSEMWGKRLEILFEISAGARRLGVLAQPGEPASAAQLPHVRSAAAALGKELLVVEASSVQEFSPAFGRLREWQADALVIVETGLYLYHRKALIDEATRNRWPTVNSSRQYLEVGGLVSYGVDYLDSCRRSAEYVDRVLKGARPAELPIQRPTKFELLINLKAARALGLTVPPMLLARADEVIE